MDGGAGYAGDAAGKDGVPAFMDIDMQLDQLLRYGLSDAVGTIRILLNDQLPHVRDNAQQLVTKLLTGLSHMYGGTQSAKRQRLSEIASASAGIVTGPEIAKIQAISVNCPGVVRGKVDVVFSAEYMTIRSARVGDLSFTYDSIISVIHLPHPMPHKKQTLVIFRVSSAELPRVSEIVFQLKTTEQAAILVNPDLAKETHPKLLNVDLTLPTHNNLVEFVRLMDEEHIDVVTPTEKAIPCHLKVIDGFLYLLPNGMLFLTKILFLPLDDIAKIEISGGASRTFDIMVHLHDFGIYEFTMISRDFEQTVAQYMASIHNRVVAEGGYDQAPQLADEDVHAEGAVGMQSMPLGMQSLQQMPMSAMAMQNLPSMQNLQQMHPSMMSMLGGNMGGVGAGPVGVPLPHH